MSYPTLPDEHSATKAVDELFNDYNIERVGQPSSRYTEEDMYTYYHYRSVVNHNGGSKIPDGLHRTSHGVVYVEETGDDYVKVVVDTKAEVEDEHPVA